MSFNAPKGKYRMPSLSQSQDIVTCASSPRRAGFGTLLLLLCLAGCEVEQPVGIAGGGELRFSELTGRWLLINYWAEWCEPCRQEIPELNELHEHGDELGVAVLGVNYDEIQGDSLVEVTERMKIRFPVLTEDPRERWSYEQPDVLPVTILIGPDGAFRRALRGPQTLEELLAAIEEPEVRWNRTPRGS